MEHNIWGKLEASILPRVFPEEGLENYNNRTLIPLFEALHGDFINAIMKMKGVHHLIHGYFTYTVDGQTYPFELHINNNEDLDEQDEDEIIWAIGSLTFQWTVPWRSSAARAYEKEELLMKTFIEKIIVKLAKIKFNYLEYKQKAIAKLSQEKWHHLSSQIQYLYRKAS